MIFISHKSNPDHQLAIKVKNRMMNHGVNCWIAPESVGNGEDYASEIPWAIKSCDIFLLLLSKDALLSTHVRKELDLALRYKKRILTLKVGQFDIDDRYEYLLANVQIKSMDDLGAVIDICKLGERIVSLEISRKPRRTLSVMKGDYEKNMDEIISLYPEKLEHTVFAMGIDRSSSLAISSMKGILHYVCRYFDDRYGITLDFLQEQVNRAKMIQLGHKTPNESLRFKDSLLIRVPIQCAEGKRRNVQLLLIANSQKNKRYELTHNVDEVEGIDSREIIIEVFNKCAALKDEALTLFIGAIGTNGLSFPYEVVTAEILNCFIYAQRIHSCPFNLCYSVRKSDMEQAGITVEEIMSYISTVMHFFRE